MKVLVITAMYPTPDRPAWGSFVKTQVEALRAAGVDVDVMVLGARIRKLAYPKGVLQLRHYLQHHCVDIVHAHYSYVGLVGRTQHRSPLVVTYHGSDLLGGVMNDQGHHSRFSRYMVGWGKWLARRAEAAIVQSEEMAGILDRRDNVYVLPHEIDFDTFRPTDRATARSQLGLHPERPYLLFAAHPDNQVKRFSLASAACEILRRDFPEIELLAVHRESQPRLALYMSACDCLVFPSFQEGSPNVIKQAMACNMPLVATDVGDVRQVIGDTQYCSICPAEAGAFAERLHEILAARRRTTGRVAVRHFDRSIVTRNLLDVYEKAIAVKMANG